MHYRLQHSALCFQMPQAGGIFSTSQTQLGNKKGRHTQSKSEDILRIHPLMLCATVRWKQLFRHQVSAVLHNKCAKYLRQCKVFS